MFSPALGSAEHRVHDVRATMIRIPDGLEGARNIVLIRIHDPIRPGLQRRRCCTGAAVTLGRAPAGRNDAPPPTTVGPTALTPRFAPENLSAGLRIAPYCEIGSID